MNLNFKNVPIVKNVFAFFAELKPKDLNKGRMPVGVDRIRAAFADIKDALREAESAFIDFRYRKKLQDIYLSIKTEGHVTACIKGRKSLTLKKDFAIFTAKGEIDEEWTKFFKQRWFDFLINGILDAVIYGYSLINWTGIVNNKLDGIQTMRRDCVGVDQNLFRTYPYSNSGQDLGADDVKDWNILVLTPDDTGFTNCGYGILLPVSVYAIALKNNLGFNIDFVEKFIMPFVVAKTMKREGAERQLLEDGIANMASNNSVVLDPTDTIEFVESKNTGSSYQSFGDLESRTEKKISKIFFGHADAIDSTTGKLGATGQDDAVSKALENVEEEDNKFVQYEINDKFIDKLRNLGFNIPKGHYFQFINSNEKYETLKRESDVNQVFATVVKTLSDAGHKVDSKFITEKTGIPVTEIVTPEPTQETTPKNIKAAVKNLYL